MPKIYGEAIDCGCISLLGLNPFRLHATHSYGAQGEGMFKVRGQIRSKRLKGLMD